MTRTSSTDVLAPRLALPARRLGGSVLVLLGAATAAFLAQVSLPGDRATAILNIRAGQAVLRTPEELAAITAQYGLDRPLPQQYLAYLLGLLRGDLGLSYQQFRPVREVVLDQLGHTLALTGTAVVLAWLLMLTWVVATAGRGGWLADLGRGVDTVAAALPHYWLGVVLLLVVALQLRWVPVLGGGLVGLVLPALTLAVPLAGFMAQGTRSELERVLGQPFVVSARMRGMGDLAVRLRHGVRHAVLPAVTLTGWAVGATVSGAVVVETVFTRPGIGSVLVAAVAAQDLPVVTGVVVLVAALYVGANVLVDVVHHLLDPRVVTA